MEFNYGTCRSASKSKAAKEGELNEMIATQTRDMWLTDLDNFLVALDEHETIEKNGGKFKKVKKYDKQKVSSKKKGKKRAADSEDDFEDEFKESAPKKRKQNLKKDDPKKDLTTAKKESTAPITKEVASTGASASTSATTSTSTAKKEATSKKSSTLDSFMKSKESAPTSVKIEELSLAERMALKGIDIKASGISKKLSKKKKPESDDDLSKDGDKDIKEFMTGSAKKPKSQATTAKKQTSLDSFMNEESISKASSNAGAKNKPLDISDDEFVIIPKEKK